MDSKETPFIYCRPEEKDNLFARVQSRHPYPMEAILVLTDRCNLKCDHCYNEGMNVEEELSTKEIVNLLIQLKDIGTLSLVITGGEPTLRSDFKEILSAALEQRFMVSLKSNGTLVSVSDIEEFWEMGLSRAAFSLYSADPLEHDKFVHMPGAFKRTLAAALKFKELGGKCRIATVVMGWNAGSISDILNICDEHDFDYGVDLKVGPGLDGALHTCALRADNDSLREVLSDFRLKAPAEVEKESFIAARSVCGVGQKTLSIRPNGDVWPCLALPWSMGNVREKLLKEILDTSPLLTRAKNIIWGDSEKCRTCRDYAECSRCPGDEFIEMGDVNQPTLMECRLASVRSRQR